MKSKKPSLYDAQEEQIQLQSASFVDFLTRKGVLEDHNIDNERVRKAKKDTAQRAYHNTEVLLSQYRLIIWVLECIPGELSDELEVPVHDIDALAEKIDIQTSLENARIESRVNAMMKTRYLVDRIHEALQDRRETIPDGVCENGLDCQHGSRGHTNCGPVGVSGDVFASGNLFNHVLLPPFLVMKRQKAPF